MLIDGREMPPATPGLYVVAALHRAIRATNDPLPVGGDTLAGRLPNLGGDDLVDGDAAAWLERYL